MTTGIKKVVKPIHSEAASRTVYRGVITTSRLPFEKCSPVLDKLFRFRAGKYVLLKVANTSMQISKFFTLVFWLIHGSYDREVVGSTAMPDNAGDHGVAVIEFSSQIVLFGHSRASHGSPCT